MNIEGLGVRDRDFQPQQAPEKAVLKCGTLKEPKSKTRALPSSLLTFTSSSLPSCCSSLQPPTPFTNFQPRMCSQGPTQCSCVLAEKLPGLHTPSPTGQVIRVINPQHGTGWELSTHPECWWLGRELLPTRPTHSAMVLDPSGHP